MELDKTDEEYQLLKEEILTTECDGCCDFWRDKDTIEELVEDLDQIKFCGKCMDCWEYSKLN